MDEVVGDIEAQASLESQRSRSAWRANLLTHYLVGIVGVASGAIAGISALAEAAPAITAAAGFAAALAAGLQSFLNAEAKARHHYVQASEWTALARQAQMLAKRGSDVEDRDVAALIDAARELGRVTFGAASEPAEKP
jgi:hypothetical protein